MYLSVYYISRSFDIYLEFYVSPILSSFYIAISFDPYKVGAIITSYHR